MKMGLQTRTIKKQHPDHTYGVILFKNFKDLCVLQREKVLTFFMDDKCFITIGDWDTPALTIRRQISSYGGGTSDAANHDHIPLHITPSVVLKVNPPRSTSHYFYSGELF